MLRFCVFLTREKEMGLIRAENAKAMYKSAIFLIVLGVLLVCFGFVKDNDATVFLGLIFSILSSFGLYFVYQEKTLVAKVLWGIGTPLLIFISPLLFSLSQPTSILSYGYLYIGGMLFSAYSFQDRKEKPFMWLSIGLFLLGLMFYDRVMTQYYFSQSNFTIVFNENYWHFKITQVFHFTTLVYLIHLVHRNKISIENQLSEKIKKLQDFTSNLISTSKNKLIHSGNLNEAIEEILRSTAEVMEVSRISVWEVDEDQLHLNLVVCYNVLKKEFSYEGRLNCNDCPAYLKALLEEKIIVANDVYNDPVTVEFRDTYTKPLGIKSMMDSPFFMDGKFKGILCCEEQRDFKEWDEMDQLFSMSISKLISISYYCCIRKEQYAHLELTSKELEAQNAMMASVNEKITAINGELSNDLLGKEQGIKEMQRFIDEMSFKNAHHVRGPLSRVLGLLHLYQVDTVPENRAMYIGYLHQSANELDNMIKEISLILSKKNLS